MNCVQCWHKPVEVGVVVKPVGQCAVAVQGETLVEYVEGNILKRVVVQRHLEGKKEKEYLRTLYSS